MTQLQSFLISLIEAGFSVTRFGNRYRVVGRDKKYEIIAHWCQIEKPHIGQVDTFASNGKWVVKPQDIEEQELILLT